MKSRSLLLYQEEIANCHHWLATPFLRIFEVAISGLGVNFFRQNQYIG